jgi:hypothetical protein
MLELKSWGGRIIATAQTEAETLKQMVERADLRGADLGGADLGGADLSRANLSGANLGEADLSGANLRGADLREADLRRANLRGANLSGANLSRANLGEADLGGADLSRADLGGANLSRANLGEANLGRADLGGANLRGADLREADLSRANLRRADLGEGKEAATLPMFWILPEEGSFIGWKAVPDYILKLEIPAAAKRTSSLTGRKCRAEFVNVLEIFNEEDGSTAPDDTEGHSWWQPATVYKKGATVYADGFDDDIRIECAQGIHFFITRKEAEEFDPWV